MIQDIVQRVTEIEAEAELLNLLAPTAAKQMAKRIAERNAPAVMQAMTSGVPPKKRRKAATGEPPESPPAAPTPDQQPTE